VLLRCSRSILLVWFAKGSVFLEGFKVTTFVVLCFVIWFDCLVDYPVVFWGLDVALGLRVNQYKLLVYFSLTLNSFKFCFKLWRYKQPIVFMLLCCITA